MRPLIKITFVFTLGVVFSMTGLKAQETVSPDYVYSPAKPCFRFSIGGGYAGRLGERQKEHNPALDKISKSLMNGFGLVMDAHLYSAAGWGGGLVFNYIQASGSGNSVNIPDYGHTSFYKETNRFLYIAPAFAGKVEFAGSWAFFFDASLGPLFYLPKIEIESSPFRGTINANKTTIGFGWGAGIEYKLSPTVALGVKLSTIIGTTKSLTVEGYKTDLDERMNLSNGLLTAFLSFRTP